MRPRFKTMEQAILFGQNQFRFRKHYSTLTEETYVKFSVAEWIWQEANEHLSDTKKTGDDFEFIHFIEKITR